MGKSDISSNNESTEDILESRDNLSSSPKYGIRYDEFTIRNFRPALKRLSESKLRDVPEVVANQLELMFIYHQLVQNQAQLSFRWALVAAGVGLLFLLSAVGIILLQNRQDAAVISLIAGSLVEVISGINFYLYRKTSTQLGDFQGRLDITQRYLLAYSFIQNMENDHKQDTLKELVYEIAGIQSIDASSRESSES